MTIYSASLLDGRPVIVMELLEGVTLRAILDAAQLTLRQSFVIMEQLLQSVAYAHKNGLTHKELKPDNVYVTSGGVIKLGGLGVAQLGAAETDCLHGPEAGLAIASLLTLGGTCMSPEQIRGCPFDARCDVFALGAIAYECLSGSHPFVDPRSANYAEMLYRVVAEPAPPLESVDEVTRRLEAVSMRALEKEREGRFEPCSSDACRMARSVQWWDTQYHR